MLGHHKGSSSGASHGGDIDMDVLKLAFAELVHDNDVVKIRNLQTNDNYFLLIAITEQINKAIDEEKNTIKQLKKRVDTLEFNTLEKYCFWVHVLQ